MIVVTVVLFIALLCLGLIIIFSQQSKHCKCANDSESFKTDSAVRFTNALFPIMNPEFNAREVAKQCLLLEDHINNPKKRCVDCIRKHFLIIDGLLEEAISLEQDEDLQFTYISLLRQWVELEKDFSHILSRDGINSMQMMNLSSQIRQFRKPLMNNYFDLVLSYAS